MWGVEENSLSRNDIWLWGACNLNLKRNGGFLQSDAADLKNAKELHMMKMTPGQREIDKMFKRRDRYEIPDWQRQKIWPRAKKQKLIDTILRGWKLPKFYFYKIAEDQFEVVDGQQRLTAIFEFNANILPLSETSAQAFGAEYYKDLPITISEAFDDFEIEYDEIENATDEELKEFFQRLQEGLPTTSSEKLNSIHSKFRDYCKRLASHEFFKKKVGFPDTRYAHFDVIAKVATLELEGISSGLRYDDLKKVFDNYASFSPTSAGGKKLKQTFDYLNHVFSERSPLLKNRTIVQSFATIVARILSTGKGAGSEAKVRKFFEQFMKELSAQIELGQNATDADYIAFQRSVSANLIGGAKVRQEVLLRKLLTLAPEIAELFDPSIVAESGLRGRVVQLGESVSDLVSKTNLIYSSVHGDDLFKPTNKSIQALRHLGKPAKDFSGYKDFVDELYFLFHESVGLRLAGFAKVQSFADINALRTELRHDVDHGSKGKVRAKRRNLSAVFAKYAGASSPLVIAPEKFLPVQANILLALESDLLSLSSVLVQSAAKR